MNGAGILSGAFFFLLLSPIVGGAGAVIIAAGPVALSFLGVASSKESVNWGLELSAKIWLTNCLNLIFYGGLYSVFFLAVGSGLFLIFRDAVAINDIWWFVVLIQFFPHMFSMLKR